jgi:predicted RNA-binding Zn-ribbon protein involved in translation (DUF1610 family)
MPMEESETRKKIVFAGVAVAFLALIYATWSTMRTPKNSVDQPDGTYWTCKNGHKFNVSTRDLNKFQAEHYGERYPCPTCGTPELVRSVKCPKCGEIYAPGGERRGAPGKCPKCGEPEPPPTAT